MSKIKLLNKLKANDHEVKTLLNNSDFSESQESQHISDWLGQVLLLKGVPIEYIVPHQELLPNESIRFFTMDMEWINHLITGALSIGVHSHMDEIINKSINDVFKEKSKHTAVDHIENNVLGHLKEFLSDYEKEKLKLRNDLKDEINNHSDVYDKKISGFIMKSDFVDKWPGVHLKAMDDRNIELHILRSDVIGNGLKICLFSGHLTKLLFYENTGALSFGFDISNTGALEKILRENPESTENLNTKINLSNFKKNKEEDGVYDIASLAKEIQNKTTSPDPITSDYFAYYMLQGADNVKFDISYNQISKDESK